MGSRQSSAILQQPHAWAAAPVDEPNPSLLQRPPKGGQDGSPRLGCSSLELAERDDSDLGSQGEVVLRPVEQGAGGAALCWCHSEILSEYRFPSTQAIYNFN
jgi:hypothetical protein